MLHNQLEALRLKANLTCKQVAQASNISESTVSRILSGETAAPSFENVANIVIACHGSIDELVGIREVGETKSPSETLREEYEDRIACIKAEHRDHIREINQTLLDTRAESARREEALNRSGDRKVYFVIAMTAALMVAQGIIDVFLFSHLL